MESSAINPKKSRKRAFSESSSPFAEREVIEIAPPLVSNSKAKGKQKVTYHEIIDLDLDDDCDDVVVLEGQVVPNKKAKVDTGTSLGPSSAAKSDSKKFESNKKGKEILVGVDHSSKGFNPGSNNFFDLDDYVFDDEYDIGLIAGVEAVVPWLPDLVLTKKDNPAMPFVTSNSTNFTISGPSTNFDSKYVPVHSNFTQTGSGNFLSNNYSTQDGNGPSSLPQLALNTAYPLGMDTLTSEWHSSFMKNTAYPQFAMNAADMSSGTGVMYSMNDMGQDASMNGPSSLSSSSVKSSKSSESSSKKAKLVDDDVKERYENFKKFDTAVDHSDHYYVRQNLASSQPPKNWAKKIQEEWKILEKDLPDTIFARAYESRMDLLRAVIIGAEGTPYHDGLFFFDVCFPSNYPNIPPLVHYHSGGLRINPNLYNCGKVCLSLLNTWTGEQTEKWVPGTSTMLQVLVSIQGLILNMKPFFNEPGYAYSSGSPHGETSSLRYNESTLILSLKTMVYTMTNPPKHFEDLVIGHFQHRVRDILMACKAYTEGVQVGCLVKGGVQDVDEGNNSCSDQFKHNVASYVKTLVGAFKKIGSKEAAEFLSLIPAPSGPCPSSAPTSHTYNPIPATLPYKVTKPSYSSHGYPPLHLKAMRAHPYRKPTLAKKM